METLFTPRFTLTPLAEHDWPFFLQLRQDDEIMRYMAEVAPEAAIRVLFDQRLQPWVPGAPQPLDFIIRAHGSDTPLGNIGLRHGDEGPAVAEVGYTVAVAAQGRGIAGEALQALCEFAFRQTGIRTLKAVIVAENGASARVLEKNGFQRVAVLKANYTLNGHTYDDWVYQLSREA
ncbi:GNAT family N-acetyltransferase [Chimaeribacter californicus]|uniref:GNAT family N-acetyltransferase n=1 Tax=Chimaeribacter californicus TaxID=2060067 RepID=A0A2N5DWD2_9GAMM|nr:GNAT family N-acetyltransferase [Chimaeribacter californicus]PLR31480.1 GNAT family N-acetyltransferase [Chimaeribacter californicus]